MRDMTYDMIPRFSDNYEPDIMLSTLIVLTMGQLHPFLKLIPIIGNKRWT